MEVPQKAENRTTIWPSNPLLGIYLKKTKTLIRKDTCTPMFITALFTIAKIRNQPECPSTDEWIKMWYDIHTHARTHTHTHTHTHTMENYSAIKKWNFAICNSMDGLGGYYAQWNKLDRKRQILYDITYMRNLKNKTSKYNKKETDSQA